MRRSLTRARIHALARGFDRETPTARREARLKSRLAARRRRGACWLTRTELLWLGEWKTPRIRPLIARNTPAGVRELTRAAFAVPDETLRLRLLMGLSGVGLPVASVILHFAWPSRYPIYDRNVRAALRRLGVRRGFPPTPSGWVAYLRHLRALARRRRVSLRTLDKALWRLGAARTSGPVRPRASLNPP